MGNILRSIVVLTTSVVLAHYAIQAINKEIEKKQH